MSITFRVDDVTPITDRLPSGALDAVLPELLGVDLHQSSHAAQVITEGKEFHSILQAVHVAFAQHRPLALSPDHLWLTLAQGFASHVDRNAEALRKRFVRHDGKETLLVEVLEMPKTAETWGRVVGAFEGKLAEHVGPGLQRLLECAFTTTTDVERVASGVVMMSAFKRYFNYTLACICGIPEITLEGTPADWKEIRRRAEVLAEYDLEWWIASLRSVLDALVRTAEGSPDRDFWQAIYKPVEAYGGEIATGWIMRLFPYLKVGGQNPAVLEGPSSAAGRARWITPGIAPGAVPMAWSNARLRVRHENGEQRMLTLFGGFGGVRQDARGVLRPEVAWAIGATPHMTAIVERIASEHAPGPSAPGAIEDMDQRSLELPGELIELYERMDGAVLFDRWKILPRSGLAMMIGSPSTGFRGLEVGVSLSEGYQPASQLPVIPFCVIQGDGRFLALYESKVVLCDPRISQDVEEIPVVATSVAGFFDLLLKHEGKLWFDTEPSGVFLYEHLSRYHEHLRRALTEGPHAPPTDLTRREKYQIVMMLCFETGSRSQREFVWQALKTAIGCTKTFDEVFRKWGILSRRRIPNDVFKELGMDN